jgi:hypothetical protein
MGVGLGSVEMPSAPVAPAVSAAAELPSTPATPVVETLSQDGIIKNLEDKVEGMQEAEAAEIKTDANENTKTEEKSSAEEPSIIPGTEVQPEKDLQSDPLYQKSLGEVTNSAISKGEPLDGKKLQEEALARYQQEKAKEPTEDNTEQQTVDKKMEEAVKRIGTLLENNRENLESAMVTVSAADLVLLLKLIAEAKEPNPKKKETKLMLILKLLGVLVLSGVMETGKTVVPPTTQG